jgi:hypothetical protein
MSHDIAISGRGKINNATATGDVISTAVARGSQRDFLKRPRILAAGILKNLLKGKNTKNVVGGAQKDFFAVSRIPFE